MAEGMGMRFALVILVSLPPLLLLNAWAMMKIKQYPPPQVSDEQIRRLLQSSVNIMRIILLAHQKSKENE